MTDETLTNGKSIDLGNTNAALNKEKEASANQGIVDDNSDDDIDEDIKADQNEIYWGRWSEFFLSCIGYAIGYANALRFPYICYKHGGGAFLIPYLISAVFFGVPTLYMELALGQYYRMGPGTLWKNVCPLLKGLGIAMVISCVWDVIRFHIIIAWNLYYLYASFWTTLPWASCNQTWNTANCYVAGEENVTGSPASVEFLDHEVFRIDPTGALNHAFIPHLIITLLIAWMITYCAMCMGIESSGKVVYFTATAPYIMLTALLIRGVTLPGASKGILYFLVPDFKKLASLDPWSDALGQVLGAIGIGFGAIITMGSYNRPTNKVGRDSIYVMTLGCCTSLISGILCFSVIGYLAHITNKPFSSLITEGIVLAFVAYPEAIAKLPSPHFWAITFFIMLILLGMDSIYGMVETCITTVVRFSRGRWEKKKPLVMLGIATVFFICGLIYATRAGLFWLILIDTFILGPIILGLTLFESLAISLAYGANRLADNIEEMVGVRPSRFFIYSWKFICPLGILFLFIVSLAKPHPIMYLGKPADPWANGVGIGITLSVLIWVPVFAIIQFYYAEGKTWKEKWYKSFSPRLIRKKRKNTTGKLLNGMKIKTEEVYTSYESAV